VSYALAFSERALDDLRRLPAWLQEDALDEIERLSENPDDRPARRGSLRAQVLDFMRKRPPETHYVFITFQADSSAKTLRVLTLGHYARPDSA
jgi:plasmid stabilization system protein ParE